MLQPHTLTVLTTNNCTAACDHCCMYSEPGRSGELNCDVIKSVVDDLHRKSKLYTIVFAGGEPTLIKKDLYKSIEYCASLGIVTRMVTNASWGIRSTTAKRVLNRLKNAGLMELNISADDYHLPYIPFERVKTVWNEVKGMKFSCCVITNSSGPKSLVTPNFIQEQLNESLHIVELSDSASGLNVDPAPDGTIYFINHSELQKVGRGNELLADDHFRLLGDEKSVSGPCPFAARSAALSPTGKLLACCGFEAVDVPVLDFGDTREKRASDLIADANEDVILNAIAYLGPSYLYNLAKSKDPTLNTNKRFGSVCEVCENVVKNPQVINVLRKNIPEIAVAVIETKRARDSKTS